MITFREILDLLAEKGASRPPEPAPVNPTSSTRACKHKHSPSGSTEFSAKEMAAAELLRNLRSTTPEKDSCRAKGSSKSRISDSSTVAIERKESPSLPENPGVSMDIAISYFLAAVWEFKDADGNVK